MSNRAIVLALALCGAAGLALLCISGIAPTDDVVIKNFQEQRAAFEKLSAMLRVDKEIQYVTTEQISMVGAIRPLTLPSTSWDDRFREYASLLKRSNASIVVRSDDRICVTVWKWGAGALGSSLVNLCWKDNVTDREIKEADGSVKYVDGNGQSLKYLSSNWFLERRAY